MLFSELSSLVTVDAMLTVRPLPHAGAGVGMSKNARLVWK